VEQFEVRPTPAAQDIFAGIAAFTVQDKHYLHELQPDLTVHFEDARGSAGAGGVDATARGGPGLLPLPRPPQRFHGAPERPGDPVPRPALGLPRPVGRSANASRDERSGFAAIRWQASSGAALAAFGRDGRVVGVEGVDVVVGEGHLRVASG
jgi:hypothetical protein